MTDFLGTFSGDVREDDAHDANGYPPSAPSAGAVGTAATARHIDEEDVPQPAPGQTPLVHGWTDPSDEADQYGPEPWRGRVIIPDELRTFHAPVRILFAETATFPLGLAATSQLGTQGKPLGLDPSRVQAQTIAYSVWTVVAAGALDVAELAETSGALETMRYLLVPGQTLRLPGLPGAVAYARNTGAAALVGNVTVSVAVFGR